MLKKNQLTTNVVLKHNLINHMYRFFIIHIIKRHSDWLLLSVFVDSSLLISFLRHNLEVAQALQGRESWHSCGNVPVSIFSPPAKALFNHESKPLFFIRAPIHPTKLMTQCMPSILGTKFVNRVSYVHEISIATLYSSWSPVNTVIDCPASWEVLAASAVAVNTVEGSDGVWSKREVNTLLLGFKLGPEWRVLCVLRPC